MKNASYLKKLPLTERNNYGTVKRKVRRRVGRKRFFCIVRPLKMQKGRYFCFMGGISPMAWVFLGIAGLMEVFWATCLKLSEGFTKLGFSALTIVGMLVSFGLLSQAMKTLPLGTAYGIWTGIGALGAVIVGLVLFKEPATAWRMFFAALLLIGIVGLKITSPS